jgi:hypothetical protein
MVPPVEPLSVPITVGLAKEPVLFESCAVNTLFALNPAAEKVTAIGVAWQKLLVGVVAVTVGLERVFMLMVTVLVPALLQAVMV